MYEEEENQCKDGKEKKHDELVKSIVIGNMQDNIVCRCSNTMYYNVDIFVMVLT